MPGEIEKKFEGWKDALDPENFNLLAILKFRHEKADFTFNKSVEHTMISKLLKSAAETITDEKWKDAIASLNGEVLKSQIQWKEVQLFWKNVELEVASSNISLMNKKMGKKQLEIELCSDRQLRSSKRKRAEDDKNQARLKKEKSERVLALAKLKTKKAVRLARVDLKKAVGKASTIEKVLRTHNDAATKIHHGFAQDLVQASTTSSVSLSDGNEFESDKNQRNTEGCTSATCKETEETLVEYSKVLECIETVREDGNASFTNPLWWGIIDLREEDVSPLPRLPRAKEFLSATEIDTLRQMAVNIIQKESRLNPSVTALMEALSVIDVIGLRELGREVGAFGIAGICEFFKEQLNVDDKRNGPSNEVAQIQETLKNINPRDEDTAYVGRCLQDANLWVRDYNVFIQSERTVDMHIVGPLAKVPNSPFVYGEKHSLADQSEKSSRSNSLRSGKPCDYLYKKHLQEISVGENTGPDYNDHHDKAITDFVDLVKVARAQHISIRTRCVESCGSNPLPTVIADALKLITIPFFHVIGMRVRFYMLIQITGDLYSIWEWGSEELPTKDTDLGEVVLLCQRFLTYRNLMTRTESLIHNTIKRAKIIRNSTQTAIPTTPARLVKLAPIVTPKTKTTSRK